MEHIFSGERQTRENSDSDQPRAENKSVMENADWLFPLGSPRKASLGKDLLSGGK